MMDPILAEATAHVAPLPAMTKPLGTTFTEQHYYFRSPMAHTSVIRPDGKKLPFMNHYFKTNIIEDILHMRQHIAHDPSFLECSEPQELELADAALDPKGAFERRVRAQVLAELQAAGVEIPKIVADVASVQQSQIDGMKIAGVDASTLAKQRLAGMRGEKQADAGGTGQQAVVNAITGAAAPMITPVSSSDIAGAAAGSTSGGAAPAAAGPATPAK